MQTKELILNKDDKILVGLSWENLSPNEEADVDLLALMLDKNSKLLNKNDLIFYNNLFSRTGALFHTGDNKTGNSSLDDEVILANLSQIPNSIRHIKFAILNHNQNNNIANISFRIARLDDIYDTKGENIYTHTLKENVFHLLYIFDIEKTDKNYIIKIKLKNIVDLDKDVFKRYNIRPE